MRESSFNNQESKAEGVVMSVHDLKRVSAEEVAVSDAEVWQLRVNPAAACRLAAFYRWDDQLATHISVRIPGKNHRFFDQSVRADLRRGNGIVGVEIRREWSRHVGRFRQFRWVPGALRDSHES